MVKCQGRAWRVWGQKARDRLPDGARAAVYASSHCVSVCATVTDVGTDYGQVYGWSVLVSSVSFCQPSITSDCSKERLRHKRMVIRVCMTQAGYHV